MKKPDRKTSGKVVDLFEALKQSLEAHPVKAPAPLKCAECATELTRLDHPPNWHCCFGCGRDYPPGTC